MSFHAATFNALASFCISACAAALAAAPFCGLRETATA
jgi:hypothetical protein